MASTPGQKGSSGTLATIELAGPEDLATSWIPNDEEGGPALTLPAGRERYMLLDTIGSGAMGTVHRAKDQDLRRIVAFKTVKHHGSTDTARRLLTEVQVTAQLDHPGVVPVYGLEVSAEGGPGYAMKFVEGRTLSQVLDETRRQAREAGGWDQDHDLAARLDIFLRICDALAYAHSKGVVHRDLKPPNVMVGPFGEVYVMDWGIARVVGVETDHDDAAVSTLDLDDGGHRTRIGQVFGTPAYMAPEQARGEIHRIGPRTDVFALGLILYELAVLQRAYRAEGGRPLLEQAQAGAKDPPEPPAGCPRPPRELLAIADKATAVEPHERYRDVQDLADDVGRFLRGDETTALPDGPLRRAIRWLGRRQQLLVGLVALALALGAAGIATTWSIQQERLHSQALAAEERAGHLTAFKGEVGDRGQRIDNHFLWVEGQLEGLSAAAVYAYSRGTPVQRPTYSAADYADPARAPADLVPSVLYGKPISPTYAVYTVAPGVPEARWHEDLALADGLREHLRSMLLVSPPDSPTQGDADDATWIADRGNPIVWAYIAVDRSGLMYMSPGAAGWDELYDPRTRPWYRVTVGKEGNVWGTPYVDLMGQGRLLSATRALNLPDGSFLGVAGIDLQFEQVVEQLVAADDLPGYLTAYLVDARGRVMVESTAKDAPYSIPSTQVLDPGIDFGPARRPEVRAAAMAGTSGQIEVSEGGRDLLISWTRLPSVSWTYVVEADLDAWLAARQQ